MNNLTEISIVSPVYKAENIVKKLVEELKKELTTLNVSYEIILVDDRSPDNSWAVIQDLATQHNELKCLRLSRNFGQHPAIMAGLSHATGNWVVVMDCDLQDRPKEVLNLYKKAQEGYDVVLAQRTNRKDGFIKKASSKLFYKAFNFLTGVAINNEIGNFGIYNKKVITSILKIGDAQTFFPLFVQWVGFKTVAIEVEHAQREEGSSSYNWMKLFKLAFNTIISFSDKPLRIFLKLGLLISGMSFFGAIYILYKALKNEIEVMGYSSIFISICFFSGIIITFLGLIGIYLSKAFNQVKNRPLYIIDDV